METDLRRLFRRLFQSFKWVAGILGVVWLVALAGMSLSGLKDGSVRKQQRQALAELRVVLIAVEAYREIHTNEYPTSLAVVEPYFKTALASAQGSNNVSGKVVRSFVKLSNDYVYVRPRTSEGNEPVIFERIERYQNESRPEREGAYIAFRDQSIQWFPKESFLEKLTAAVSREGALKE